MVIREAKSIALDHDEVGADLGMRKFAIPETHQDGIRINIYNVWTTDLNV